MLALLETYNVPIGLSEQLGHMETGLQLKVSSDRLEKQRIEPVTHGLQGKLFCYPIDQIGSESGAHSSRYQWECAICLKKHGGN